MNRKADAPNAILAVLVGNLKIEDSPTIFEG